MKITNGDLVLDTATGRFVVVEGTSKLLQDTRQNLLTDPQPNGTGAGMASFVGQVGDPTGLRMDMTRSLHNSFEALKQVQNRTQKLDRSPEERIRNVNSVVVAPIRSVGGVVSMTTYQWRVEVASEKPGVSAPVSGIVGTNGLRVEDSIPQGNPVQIDLLR